MGTSKSSDGSPSNVPMVPPWVPDPIPADGEGSFDGTGNDSSDGSEAGPEADTPSKPIQLAPTGRFGPARTSLGNFARTGSTDDMRRGVGHYVRKGFGGSSGTARRFGGTSRTAGTLYGALSAVAAGQPSHDGSPFDPALLSGSTVDEVIDAVVEAVRPVDGTQDTEASRDAISNALADLLERYPQADLLGLSPDERLYVIERYVSLDVYNRFRLDVGKTLQEKAPSATAALSRLKEVKDYIRQKIAASFRKTQEGGRQPNARRISGMVHDALADAFGVFEGYLK